MPRASFRGKRSLHTCTGAAATRFWVKTPAAAAGMSLTISARSRRPGSEARRPQWTPAKRKPLGSCMETFRTEDRVRESDHPTPRDVEIAIDESDSIRRWLGTRGWGKRFSRFELPKKGRDRMSSPSRNLFLKPVRSRHPIPLTLSLASRIAESVQPQLTIAPHGVSATIVSCGAMIRGVRHQPVFPD